MLAFLPKPLRAVISSSLFVLNSIWACLVIYPLAILRLLIPIEVVQVSLGRLMFFVAETWISINSLNMQWTQKIEWDIQIPKDLKKDKSYLVFSNHQSWMDIVILQKAFNRKIPFFRFFLKQELIYVPLLGLAWWALDFPFMKRYSKEYLEKYPEKRGKDMETTRRACTKFKGRPVSIINFLEGTRFTEAKKLYQKSPYNYLLRPKAGGVAFVLSAMGEQFDSILDVTIDYPKGVKSLGQTFAGQLDKVQVRAQLRPIDKELLGGDYMEDPRFREKMQSWVSQVWEEKDQALVDLKAQG